MATLVTLTDRSASTHRFCHQKLIRCM